jgi:molybdate transport system permease protein
MYDHVEALAYDQAHPLAAAMVLLSFLTLLVLYFYQKVRGRAKTNFGVSI